MPAETSSQRSTTGRLTRVRQVLFETLQVRAAGAELSDQAVLAAHPELLPELAIELAKVRSIVGAVSQANEDRYSEAMSRLRSDWSSDRRAEDAGLNETTDFALSCVPLAQFGRYRIERTLGTGGFGVVYLAHDDELKRLVAIKVPRAKRLSRPEEMADFVAEARLVAALDHPAIVPVYDAGRTADGVCFVVSKFIAGTDLAQRMKTEPVSRDDAIQIGITVAEALHYAHELGVVHRDIKPANILLDPRGQPFVTDFGLALKSEDSAPRGRQAGTPSYMSPEQARGEGHRVDGRSDLFSLGVVLYQLLTGRRPFDADRPDELLEQIVWHDPPPPRAIDASIPPELERICLKCLAKRAADRYSVAEELADDLRQVILAATAPVLAVPGVVAPRVVPKGLRAFDANDAEFFLELLPGPRDRDGMPESLRQWKSRIESAGDESFAVGVLYGPSGCGKSSLIRAGLLPRLDPRIDAIYLEATPDDTEERLRQRLLKQRADVNPAWDLPTSLAHVRRGGEVSPQIKLLIVIDQFEQWLHGRGDGDRRMLVQALRQCDGERVQCLLLVRDDFWLGLSRFLAELEIDLVPGRNAALVDLFDRQHARRVLLEFGRAFDRLPRDQEAMTDDQRAFVDGAIAGLTIEDKVIPVRLALFAEMVKARAWTPATLAQIGGAEGVGVTFLEEALGSRSGNALSRRHEAAARGVLESLLPAPGSPIKGAMRSYPELLDLSGYGRDPRAFKELMRVLDAETRLLTPTERAVPTSDAPRIAGFDAQPPVRYYQLTHDYLVPSLREWLAQKQRQSPVGRTELRLAERTKIWTAHPERRQLPSMWEWLAIRTLTRSRQWTDAQRKMMRAAARRQALALVGLAVIAAAFLVIGSEVSAWGVRAFRQMRAKTAVAWLAVGRGDSIWPLFGQSDDATVRTELIHGLSPLVISAARLVEELQVQDDVSVRRAMLLAAGEIVAPPRAPTSSVASARESVASDDLIDEIRKLHEHDADSGIHGAADWFLRRMGHEDLVIQTDGRSQSSASDRQWYVAEGHVMSVIAGPIQFAMGSSIDDPERRDDEIGHRRRIARSFSIASKETTVGQYQRFLREWPENSDHSEPTPFGQKAPQTFVSWFKAAAYCNWLSKKAGVPRDQWCYEPNAAGRYEAGTIIAGDALQRRGFRLPTEAEWEFACRAGTTTSRFTGDSAAYLERYAIFGLPMSATVLPVGERKPNDWGLFDMLGNAAEWCHDRFAANALRAADNSASASRPEAVTEERCVRGGSFVDNVTELRAAARQKLSPDQALRTIGFRVARSYP